MKLSINRHALISALAKLKDTAKAYTNRIILRAVRLAVESDSAVKLTVTNLDEYVTLSLPAKCEQSGIRATCIPFGPLFSILPRLSDETVTIEQEQATSPLAIFAGDVMASIETLHEEEFPPTPVIAGAHLFRMDSETLRSLLSRVSCAQSQDETRYVLNGILCEVKDNTFKAIATDGRRLCVAETEIEIAKESERDFIIPTPAVQAIIRLLSTDGTVVIAVSESGDKAAFTIGDHAVVTTKLIEGQYPKWRYVIPPPATRRHTFPSLAVINALQRVATGNHEKINAAKLTFHPDHIIVTNGGSEPPVRIVEKIKHTQPPDAGPMPFECFYSPAFLTDGIQSCNSEIVSMGLGEKIEQPAMLTGESSGFFYILLPIRKAE